MRKYKVGDKVRVKVYDEIPGRWNIAGEMNWCMGKVFKISSVDGSLYHLEEASRWVFRATDLEPVGELERRYHTNDFYLERCGA